MVEPYTVWQHKETLQTCTIVCEALCATGEKEVSVAYVDHRKGRVYYREIEEFLKLYERIR